MLKCKSLFRQLMYQNLPDITLQQIDHSNLSQDQVANRLIYLHEKRQLALQQYKENDPYIIAAGISLISGMIGAAFKGNAMDIALGIPTGQKGVSMVAAGVLLFGGFLLAHVLIDKKRRKICPHDARDYDYWLYDTVMAHPKYAGEPSLGNTYIYPETATTWHSRQKISKKTIDVPTIKS